MSDFEAITFLRERGFIFHNNGMIDPPNYKWPYAETAEEKSYLDYLCWEWDFGYPFNAPGVQRDKEEVSSDP